MQPGVIASDVSIGRLGLRPEAPEDDDFLLALYESTRAAEMELTNWTADQRREFLRSQFQLQRTHYRRYYTHATFDVITLDDVPIGRMYVHSGSSEIRLMEISIDPALRGRGIGTQLVQSVLAEAERLGKTVTLHVEPYNPALRLYQRLGFTIVEERGLNFLLERRSQVGRAAATISPTASR